ncbi:PCME [Mytilus edulis]|uniref:PCME n=1 Tax=Mytilus edulis TaxID=6550 RepID=A0A8S3QC97_MYTED|nr:PCME [Mytilus edulis]
MSLSVWRQPSKAQRSKTYLTAFTELCLHQQYLDTIAMLKQIVQTVLLVTSTAVVIPYTTSLLGSLLYGWPNTKNKYRRAFSPKKVYAFNFAVLQKLYTTLKYASSYLKWKKLYNKTFTVRKNIPYGRNDCTLDLYHPNIPRKDGGDMSMPVVVFVYGGAWSSGEKTMYGPLCVEIANRLKAVVCCPNLSIYPKGYVDDMIQDVVDCVAWVCDNPHMHGANKNDIVLIGHSSGAHLCVMSVLELLSLEIPGESQQSRIRFDESYFNNKPRSDTLDDSSGSSASFCVVNDNQEKSVVAPVSTETKDTMPSLPESTEGTSLSTSTFEMVKSEEADPESQETDDNTVEKSVEKGDNSQTMASGDINKEETELKPTSHTQDLETINSNDEIARPKELEPHATLTDLSKSIKVVIGLAGVYNISDHFEHESRKGIEDISCMARAMYGQEYFDRFSPIVLSRTLSPNASAPCVLLLHGTEDYVVPVTSTTKLAEALQDNMMDVTVRIIPGCDHYEICLDMMLPKSKFYKPMIDLLLEVTNKVLNRKIVAWSDSN